VGGEGSSKSSGGISTLKFSPTLTRKIRADGPSLKKETFKKVGKNLKI